MTETNLQKLKELNFRQAGICWIGKVDDCYYSIKDKQDSEDQLLVTITLAPNENKSKLIECFDQLQKDGVIAEYSLDKNDINILFNESGSQYIDDFLTGISKEIKNIEGVNTCSSCDSTEGLAFYTNGTVHSLLCEECGKNVLTQLEEEKNKNTNYLTGFLASIAGALVGSVLWIFLGAIGFFASIAGLLIAFGAFKGYEMAKGKLTRFGIVLNVISILFGFIFAQYIVIYIIFKKETPDINFLMYILATPMIFSDPEILKAVLQDMGLGFIFIVLGTYKKITDSYSAAKNSENLTIEKIEF